MQLLQTLRRVASQSLLFALLLLTITNQLAAQTQPTDHFRSRASGNWGAPATWESSPDGVNWVAATINYPTSESSSILIRTGHTITAGSSSQNGDQMMIESGGTLKVTVQFFLIDGEGVDLTVYGLLIVDALISKNPSAEIIIKNGGEYQKNINANSNINICTWESGSIMRLKMSSTINTIVNISQPYYNFIIDGATMTIDSYLNLPDNFSINGDFIVTTTVAKKLTLNMESGTKNLFIAGDFILQNTSYLNLSSSGQVILNIGGNIDIGYGTGTSRLATGTATVTNNIIKLRGNLILDSSGDINTYPGDKNGNLVFINNSDVQTFSNNGEINYLNYIINENVTVSADNLNINTGYSLTIEQGGSLDVTNLINSNSLFDKLIIKDGASLITNSSTIKGTMQRTLSNADWAIPLDGWHLLSSPVAAQALNTGGFLEADYDFYKWSEPQNLWLNQKVSSNNITSFTPGEGYFVAYDNGGTKTFTGTFNTASLPFVNLSKTTDSPYSGFHLLGNPFPCALDWGSGSWNRTNFSDVAMVWNEAAMNYIPLTAAAGNIIPACQGFFVQALSATNSITVPADARTHGSAPFNKKTAAAGLLHLKVTSAGNESWDEAIIMCDPTALKEFDRMDGHEMQGSENAPQLWTVTGDEMLCVNSLPADDVPPVIPLYFRPGSDGNYLLEVADITMPAPVYLEDLVTDKVILLENSVALPFTAAGGDAPERFRLHTGPVGLPQDKTVAPLTVYSSGNTVTISDSPGKHLKGEVAFSDLSGKVVKQSTINSRSPVTIQACDLATGVYLVAVKLSDRSEVFKVYILN